MATLSANLLANMAVGQKIIQFDKGTIKANDAS